MRSISFSKEDIDLNEKYIGNAILRKTFQRDLLSPYRVKNTGQRPQKYVENNHPAIVDIETFDAVQAELARRKTLSGGGGETGKSRYSSKYPLSGIIRCGTCGSVLRRHFYRWKDKRTPVWACSAHIAKGNAFCPQKALFEQDLEELFTSLINEIIADKDGVVDKVKEFLTECPTAADTDNTAALQAEIDGRIKALQDEMFALNCDRAKKVITHEEYTEKTAALMIQLDELFVQRDEVAGSKSQAFHDSLTMAGIERLLEEAKNQETLDQTTCACLLKSAIAKPDGTVEFELKNGVVLTGRLPQKGWGTGKAKRVQSEDSIADDED